MGWRRSALRLRLSASGASLYRGRDESRRRVLVFRFAIRLESLPAADVTELSHAQKLGTGVSTLQLGYSASTQKLKLSLPSTGAVEASSTVQVGTWYVIDLKYDTSVDPHTAEWQINGVAQTSTSVAAAPDDITSYRWGTSAADTFTANYDDLLISAAAADYPLGDGKVLPLRLDGVGAHNGPGDFQDDDGTAIDASSWTRLDEIPMDSTTDYIQQVSASTTSYAELRFQNTAETCVRAVVGRLAYDGQNTGQANHGKTSIFDGSQERLIYSGNMTANTTAIQQKASVIGPATAPLDAQRSQRPPRARRLLG